MNDDSITMALDQACKDFARLLQRRTPSADDSLNAQMTHFLETRLVDAAWTLRRLPDREKGFLYQRQTLWPDMRQTDGQPIDLSIDTVFARKQVRPSPRQIDAMIPTMDLLRLLPDIKDRNVVFWGAWHQDGEVQARIPWAKVRRSLGSDLSRWTMKRRYQSALDWLARLVVQRNQKNYKKSKKMIAP